MSYSLNSLKGVSIEDFSGDGPTIRAITGDTRSSDESTYSRWTLHPVIVTIRDVTLPL